MAKPSFIIGGERRSGTTTLYDVLRRHPDINLLSVVDYDYFIEPELFSKEKVLDDDIKEWNNHIDVKSYENLFSGLEGVVGQKDADLLWWKPAHRRLSELLPDCKFIFILRNPIDRAESQYFNELKKNREKRSFRDAVSDEKNKKLNKWERLHLQYIERGCYVRSLENFYKFFPKQNVKVILLEELLSRKDKVLTELSDFLDVDRDAMMNIDITHTNKELVMERKKFTKLPLIESIFNFIDRVIEAIASRAFKDKFAKNKFRMRFKRIYMTSKRDALALDKESRKELLDFYKPFNDELQKLTGLETNIWNFHD